MIDQCIYCWMYLLIYVFLVMGRFVGGLYVRGMCSLPLMYHPVHTEKWHKWAWRGWIGGEGWCWVPLDQSCQFPGMVGQGRYVNPWPIHPHTHPSHPPTHTILWLAPHHPILNAKFPPITAFLKLAFSHSSFSHQNFRQDFPARISRKIFPQEFSHKIFLEDFPAKISGKIFPSWILIG